MGVRNVVTSRSPPSSQQRGLSVLDWVIELLLSLAVAAAAAIGIGTATTAPHGSASDAHTAGARLIDTLDAPVDAPTDATSTALGVLEGVMESAPDAATDGLTRAWQAVSSA